MSVHPIRLFGDPVLRTRAAEVVDFDRELRTLVADLTETMRDAPGPAWRLRRWDRPARVHGTSTGR
ncbi:MAG: peptide deformylase [Nocardioides sp.]